MLKLLAIFKLLFLLLLEINIGLKEDDIVKVIYDEREGVIKIVPIKRKRTTIKLSKSISVEEIEEAIEGMMSEAVTRY